MLLCPEVGREPKNRLPTNAFPPHSLAKTNPMHLAMIGLGKMGGNMVERLMRNGHSVVAFDRDPAVVTKYQGLGATPANDLAEVVKQLASPRVVWIMVPAGKPVDSTIDTLLPQL